VSRVVAIGERELVDGYGLAGVQVLPASGATAVRRAFAKVEGDAGLLILTPAAEAALTTRLADARRLVWVVLPA
jgi:vacuolar-type H+-ATPase subunit F/Vma7